MANVYRWMVAGLAVTGAVAWYVASSQQLMAAVMPYFLPLIVVELVAVVGLSFLAPRLSAPVAAILYLGYSFLNGLTFSTIFMVYKLGSIAQAFAVTAITFGALSIYATVTKKDLSAWRTFLFMGLIGIVVASVVNIFVGSSMLSFLVACAGVLVFAGLTAYDTQKLRRIHANSGFKSAGALAVVGALMLYLDFINLFLSLLRLLGRRR